MTDQRSAWLRLRELSCNPPSPISRSEVLEALKSKSDSIRSEAAEALAKWGDAESMHSLREFLEGSLVPRDFAWVDRDIAIRVLVRCVGDTDAGWFLDLYFLPTTVDYRRDFFPLLLRLSNPSVRNRLLAECRSEDPVHRRDAIRPSPHCTCQRKPSFWSNCRRTRKEPWLTSPCSC